MLVASESRIDADFTDSADFWGPLCIQCPLLGIEFPIHCSRGISSQNTVSEEKPPIYKTRHPPLPEVRCGTSRAARSPHTVCRGERQVRAPYFSGCLIILFTLYLILGFHSP